MKKIEAYIRPEKLEDLKERLKQQEINGMSIIQTMGFGKQKGWKNIIRGTTIDLHFVPKIKIEIFTLDDYVESIVNCLIECAHTGQVGDGKIFISSFDSVIRISSNERGETVLR